MVSPISELSSIPRKLKEFSGNENYIIREVGMHMLEPAASGPVLNPEARAAEAEKFAGHFIALYTELAKKYDINVPARFIIGKNSNGKKTLFAIVDKIDGQNAGDLATKECAPAFEKLQISLLRYYIDKFASGEDYLADVAPAWQYVYGAPHKDAHTSAMAEPAFYLVDVDISRLSNYIQKAPTNIVLRIFWVLRGTNRFELATGICLSAVWNLAADFLKTIATDDMQGDDAYAVASIQRLFAARHTREVGAI